MSGRYSSGVPGLDGHLGGGLIPGTLTVVVGATGIGKSQLGLQFLAAGQTQEGRRGIICDLSCRGDSQSHADYARRMFDWQPTVHDPARPLVPDEFFTPAAAPGEYLHVFDYQGRRVSQRDLDFDTYQAWQAELVRKLQAAIGYFYGHFVRGARRVVLDGIDPTERPQESIQFELFEYLYEQVLRKEAEWVARDLFRENFLRLSEVIAAHPYDHRQVAALALYTTPETMLDQLLERRLVEGDWLANANTVLYLGKTRQSGRIGRGLLIAKHRGSYASDEILPYTIGEAGLKVEG